MHVSLDLTVRLDVDCAHDLACMVEKDRPNENRYDRVVVAHEPAISRVSAIRDVVSSLGRRVGGNGFGVIDGVVTQSMQPEAH